jgi:hypothetical protein
VEAYYDYVLPYPVTERSLIYFMYFPWLPIKAALPLFNFQFFVTKQFFEKELMKTKEHPKMQKDNLKNCI